MHDLVKSGPRLQRGDGAAEIGFAAAGGRTRLAHLHQRAPLRVLLPEPEAGDLVTAAVLLTSGGIAGGDRLALTVVAGAGSRATVCGQAAEKVYRGVGGAADSRVTLRAGGGAWLEYLPQETILFDGARLRRRIEIELERDARLLACDMLVFGRAAHGERFAHGLLRDDWRLRRDGRLAWADALRVEDGAQLDRAAGFGGGRAYASVLYAGPDAADHLDFARGLQEGCRRAGVTVVSGLLLARFLDTDAQAARQALVRFVTSLRRRIAGLPAALPRLWQC